MFSLESRPPSVPQALAADVLFDGRVALTATQRLAKRHPDRRAGSDGNLATAGNVASNLRGQHFAVTVDRFLFEDKDLVTLVGRREHEPPRHLEGVAPG